MIKPKFALRLRDRLVGRRDIEAYRRLGTKIGRGTYVGGDVIIDPMACWLVTIGEDCRIAPRVYILAHDSSMKTHLGYTRLEPTVIGDRVFIGAGAIVLCGLTIGSDVIIGAGSVVTQDVPDNSVVTGNPARVITTTDEYLAREQRRLAGAPQFDDQAWLVPQEVAEDDKVTVMSAMTEGIAYIR